MRELKFVLRFRRAKNEIFKSLQGRLQLSNKSFVIYISPLTFTDDEPGNIFSNPDIRINLLQADIKIAIADDHKLVRTGIANLLSSKGFDVVFQCDNGQHLLDYVVDNSVDIVLMDLNMPVLNGWETTSALREQCPKVKVIGLSMFDDDLSVLRIIRAGARGYLLKDAEPDELVLAINSVHTSGFYHSEMVSGFLYRNYSGADGSEGDTQEVELSEREHDFLKHCCTELTYKEIADKMNVSHRTVDGYRESLFEKLQARSRVGIVMAAIKNHLIDF